MRNILVSLAAVVLLAGCAVTPAQKTAAAAFACQVDGVVFPLVVPALATQGAPGVTAAAVDTLVVHPEIVAACAKLGGAVVVAPPAH